MSARQDVLLDMAYEQAKTILVGRPKGAQLTPTFVIMNPKEHEGGVIATPWRNDKEKYAAINLIRLVCAELAVDSYSFLSEAWLALAPEGWTPGQSIDFNPRQSPNRVEIVFAIAVERHCPVASRAWRIERGEDGGVIALTVDADMPVRLDGPMTELLS